MTRPSIEAPWMRRNSWDVMWVMPVRATCRQSAVRRALEDTRLGTRESQRLFCAPKLAPLSRVVAPGFVRIVFKDGEPATRPTDIGIRPGLHLVVAQFKGVTGNSRERAAKEAWKVLYQTAFAMELRPNAVSRISATWLVAHWTYLPSVRSFLRDAGADYLRLDELR